MLPDTVDCVVLAVHMSQGTRTFVLGILQLTAEARRDLALAHGHRMGEGIKPEVLRAIERIWARVTTHPELLRDDLKPYADEWVGQELEREADAPIRPRKMRGRFAYIYTGCI